MTEQTDYKIPQATKDLWLPALEGGTFKQCSGSLYDGYGYCCLGVLGVADGKQFVPRFDDDYDSPEDQASEPAIERWDLQSPENFVDLNNDDLLSDAYGDVLGLSAGHQAMLSALNDGTAMTVVSATDILLPVWKAIAADEGSKVTEELITTYGDEVWKFRCAKHSFAEIAAIIRKHL